ncbi:hypothetical protein SALBM217S_09589 [Streptomyces griseoloalbus]
MLINVTSSYQPGCAIRSSALSGTKWTVPPTDSGAKISKTDRSKDTDVAASVCDNSSCEKTRPAQDSIATTWECSIITPFGRPVDPDV